MSSDYRVTVNGMDISDLIVGSVSVKQKPLRQGVDISRTAQAALRLDGPRFQGLDLRGRVKVETRVGDRYVPVFAGVVVEGKAGTEYYSLQCDSPMQILQEARTGGAFGRDLHPAEVIYLLLMTVMPESAHPKNFPIGAGKTLADMEGLFRSRRFQFIAPFPACRLTERSVRLADATLYVADGVGFADDKNIAASVSAEDTPSEWRNGMTRVRFYVQAEGFIDAFEKGRQRLRRLLDYVSFAASFSTGSYKWAGIDYFPNYRRGRTVVDIRETDWAYVRDIFPSRPNRYWLCWYAPHRLSDPLTIGDPGDMVVGLYAPFEALIEEDEARLTPRRRSLLSALHALRRARHAPNTQDALHHVWQCVEFLASGQPTPETFTPQDRRALIKAAKGVIRERYQSADPEERQRREKMMEKMVGDLDKPYLQQKWNAFCAENGLTLHEADKEFLWRKMRPIRNDDVHGRTASVDRNDVERAVILEKALMAVLERLRAEDSAR